MISNSMDGRGRVFDNIFVERLWRNVKYEDVYLKGYATMGELLLGLTGYFALYNGARPHQALGYQTPDLVYRSGIGGGAMIVDKFGGAVGPAPVPLRSTGAGSTAGTRSEATATSTATSTSTATATSKIEAPATPGQRRPAAIEVEYAA